MGEVDLTVVSAAVLALSRADMRHCCYYSGLMLWVSVTVRADSVDLVGKCDDLCVQFHKGVCSCA